MIPREGGVGVKRNGEKEESDRWLTEHHHHGRTCQDNKFQNQKAIFVCQEPRRLTRFW